MSLREKAKEWALVVLCIAIMAFTLVALSWLSDSQAVASSVEEEMTETDEVVIVEYELESEDEIEDDLSVAEKKIVGIGALSLFEPESESESEIQGPVEIEIETEVEDDSPGVDESEVYIQKQADPLTEEMLIERIDDYSYDEDKAVALAQLMWAEARGCSKREQSMVAWTVLNRVDVQYDGMGDFWSILTAPYQFAYYSGNPYEDYEYEIAVDVLKNWAAEKDGLPSNRTLPQGYLYYYGDGAHNYFSTNGAGGELWFGLGDPYEG